MTPLARMTDEELLSRLPTMHVVGMDETVVWHDLFVLTDPRYPDKERWIAAQWIAYCWFSKPDIPAILALVTTHAILHQATRNRDAQARIVAALDDYAAVRELVADVVAETAGASVPKAIRQTVAAVEQLRAEKYIHCEGVGLKAIADKLNLDKSTVSRRVHAAEEKGLLVNEETKQGRPARIVLGEALPEEVTVLPTLEALQSCIASGEDSRNEIEGTEK